MKIVSMQHVPHAHLQKGGTFNKERKKKRKSRNLKFQQISRKLRHTNCHRIFKESGQCRPLTLACLTAGDALFHLDSLSEKRGETGKCQSVIVIRRASHSNPCNRIAIGLDFLIHGASRKSRYLSNFSFHRLVGLSLHVRTETIQYVRCNLMRSLEKFQLER